MKLTVEQAHSVETKKGVSRCVNCKQIEPSLQQPCPRAPVPAPSPD